ncbi:FAD:protein FMN transferase [Nonomuraea sp. NPDC050786]|uniref:FAD:protein FMN transferase n=1 Tax=Nonomuraea sp. NPDC050786 TaxID=3154840 RepID=UPI0033F60138
MTRHVEKAMGTVFSFDVRHAADAAADAAAADADGAVARAVAWLHHVDAVFSTYRPDSPVSRLARGELGPADCPPEVRQVLALCAEAERRTGGYFTACPGGRLDPSGLVKGWAIEQASLLLTEAGAPRHCVNGGGDIQLGPDPFPWRIGIAHPLRPGALSAVVTGHDLAVATSGSAERGPHIIDPHTGLPAAGLVSLTLVGACLTAVDAYATAAFAMGEAARDWVEGQPGLEAYAVTARGHTWQTSGFAAFTARG